MRAWVGRRRERPDSLELTPHCRLWLSLPACPQATLRCVCKIKPEELVLPTTPPCDTAAPAGTATACEGATPAAAPTAAPLVHPWLKWIGAPSTGSAGGAGAGSGAGGSAGAGGAGK